MKLLRKNCPVSKMLYILYCVQYCIVYSVYIPLRILNSGALDEAPKKCS